MEAVAPENPLTELEKWEWRYRWHRMLGPIEIWPESVLYQAWMWDFGYAEDPKKSAIDRIAREVRSEIDNGYALIPGIEVPTYQFRRGFRDLSLHTRQGLHSGLRGRRGRPATRLDHPEAGGRTAHGRAPRADRERHDLGSDSAPSADQQAVAPENPLTELEEWEWRYRWHRMLGPIEIWPESVLYQAWMWDFGYAEDPKKSAIDRIAKEVRSEIDNGYALIPGIKVPTYRFQRGIRDLSLHTR